MKRVLKTVAIVAALTLLIFYIFSVYRIHRQLAKGEAKELHVSKAGGNK